MSYPSTFASAQRSFNGPELAKHISLMNADFVASIKSDGSGASLLAKLKSALPVPWRELALLYANSMLALHRDSNLELAFKRYNEMVVMLVDIAIKNTLWIVPMLKTAVYELWTLANVEAIKSSANLDTVARTSNSVLKICLNDRNEVSQSKKWATYYFANHMLRIYFRLKAHALAKGILKVIVGMEHTLPSFDLFPKRDQTIFLYYSGVLEFLEQKYESADERLSKAYALCPKLAHQSQSTILRYLLPCKVLTCGQFPKEETWSNHDSIRNSLQLALTHVREGQYGKLQKFIKDNRAILLKQHLLLAFVKMEPICLLRLILKTWKLTGRSNRLYIEDLVVAFDLVDYFKDMDSGIDKMDAIELVVAKCIFEGDMKGYISHEHRTIVLSGTQPFPKLITAKAK